MRIAEAVAVWTVCIAMALPCHAEATVPLVLPPGEPLDAWTIAAAAVDLVARVDGDVPSGAWVEVIVGDRWLLRVHDAEGRVREQAVDAPQAQIDREEIALLASTLLTPAPAIDPRVVDVVGVRAEAPARTSPTPRPSVQPAPPTRGPVGAWLGVAVRADLREGRREATSVGMQGGTEFGPGFRVGGGVEGTTSARFDLQQRGGPVRGVWSFGAGGGLWWALQRAVAPLVGLTLEVQVRSFVADLDLVERVPVPVLGVELGASIGLGPVLRIEPQVRLTVDLARTDIDLGGDVPGLLAPLAVQFGIALRAFTGRPLREAE